MRIPAANRFTVLALVVLALVALAAVAWLGKPVTVSAGQQATVPRTVPVSVGMRACPAPGSPGSRGAGVAVVAAAGSSGPGQATVSRLSVTGPAAAPLRRLSQPGALSLIGVPAVPSAHPGSSRTPSSPGANKVAAAVARPGGVMVAATGSMARGLEAEQTAAGAATARCGSPGTDFWFAVPGQQSAGTIELNLMNVDSQASSVDVDVFTDTGPLHTGADTGITVPAHGLVVQSLAGLVHGSRAIALHVRTSAGRVVAALRESSQRNGAGEWLPPAQPPAQRLVVPAMPGAKGARVLYLANPGGGDAQVKLSVVSPGGTYEPTGGDAIDVPAGSANRVDLTSLSGVAGAVVLTSKRPGHRGHHPSRRAGRGARRDDRYRARPAGTGRAGRCGPAGLHHHPGPVGPATCRAGPAHHGRERPDRQHRRRLGRQHRRRRFRRHPPDLGPGPP